MWNYKNMISAVFVIAMLACCRLAPQVADAQTKANVPKPQNTLVLGEGAVKDLLLLMEPAKNGKITRQDWMKFMGEEFDRLDKDKNGEVDVQELRRLNPRIKHTPADNR